jgi:hypothetical protein
MHKIIDEDEHGMILEAEYQTPATMTSISATREDPPESDLKQNLEHLNMRKLDESMHKHITIPDKDFISIVRMTDKETSYDQN